MRRPRDPFAKTASVFFGIARTAAWLSTFARLLGGNPAPIVRRYRNKLVITKLFSKFYRW